MTNYDPSNEVSNHLEMTCFNRAAFWGKILKTKNQSPREEPTLIPRIFVLTEGSTSDGRFIDGTQKGLGRYLFIVFGF